MKPEPRPCPVCGERFIDLERYLEHRDEEHPGAGVITGP